MNNQNSVISIRDITEKDFQEALECIRKSVSITNGKDYPKKVIQYQVGQHYTLDWITRIFPTRKFVIACINNKIVGTGSVKQNELLNIFVDPDFQKRGVGKKIVIYLEDICKKSGIKEVELNSSITAKGFYTKLGYITVQETIEEWLGEQIKNTLMRKKI